MYACLCFDHMYPDSKVHGANMGPTWVLWAPDGPHVGPMNIAIRVAIICQIYGFRIQATQPTTKARQKQTLEMHNRELMTRKLMWALPYNNKLSTAGVHFTNMD